MKLIISRSVEKAEFTAMKKILTTLASGGRIETCIRLEKISPTIGVCYNSSKILLLSEFVIGTDFGSMTTLDRALLATKILKR